MLRQYDPDRDARSYYYISLEAYCDPLAAVAHFDQHCRQLGIDGLYVIDGQQSLHLLLRSEEDHDRLIERVNRHIQGTYAVCGL